MQQRRTSSRWMACRRYFLSKPRPISGIARKDERDVIEHQAGGTVGRAPLLSGIPDRRGHGSVRRVAGRNELRPYRRSGTQQDPFIYDDRRRSGTSACLFTEARDRATSDWCRLSRARSYPMRAMVPARSRGSSRRLVSGAWCRFFLNLSQVQIGGTQPLMSNSVQAGAETLIASLPPSTQRRHEAENITKSTGAASAGFFAIRGCRPRGQRSARV